MKLTSEYRIELAVDKDTVVFVLRRPTNKELNDFLSDRYDVGRRGRLKDRSIEARAEFFDLLLTGIENLEDESGAPVGPEKKELIPTNWKSAVIFSAFEDIEISEKN